MRICFFSLLFLFLSLVFVSGIGVSPADYKVNFEPGLEKSFPYYIQNNRAHPINAKVELRGEEAQKYLTVSNRLVPLSANGAGSAVVNMKLPQEFERSGWHHLSVVITEDFISQDTGFVVRTASIVPIKVFVPFPGEYAEIKLATTSAPEGEQAKIEVQIDNKGVEDLKDTTLFIKVRDAQGNIIKEWEEEDISILSKGSKKIVKYSPLDIAPGKYYVTARYEYSDRKITRERNFKIGSREAHPISITDYIETDRVSQFEVEIESYWNEKITGVYATVHIGGKIGNTHPTEIAPFGKAKVSGFIDLTGVPEQNVTAKVEAIFDGFRTQENFDVELYIAPEPIIETPKNIFGMSDGVWEVSNTFIVFFVAILILIIIAIIVILTGNRGKGNGSHAQTKHTEEDTKF